MTSKEISEKISQAYGVAPERHIEIFKKVSRYFVDALENNKTNYDINVAMYEFIITNFTIPNEIFIAASVKERMIWDKELYLSVLFQYKLEN